jgi:hypothetical protein
VKFHSPGPCGNRTIARSTDYSFVLMIAMGFDTRERAIVTNWPRLPKPAHQPTCDRAFFQFPQQTGNAAAQKSRRYYKEG